MKLDNFYNLEYSDNCLYFYCYTYEFVMKRLKKAEGHISRNIMSITMKMKTIV